MQIKHFNVYFFLILLILITSVAYFIFQPFIMPIFMAAILAILFHRPYYFFLQKTGNRKSLSAFFTSILAMFIFVGALSIVISLIVNEGSVLMDKVSSTNDLYQQYVDPLVQKINQNPAFKKLGIENLIDKKAISKSLAQLSQGSLTLIQGIYQGITSFIVFCFIMFFTLYYFLFEGRDLVKKIMYLSPLKDVHENKLIEKFVSMTRATIKGTLVIGLVQGSIGGILFAIAGIPSAAIWAILMAMFSLIPMIGSSVIWFPAGIILLIMGNVWQGVMVLVVGIAFISLIDNFLRPKLVGKDTQMHPLIIFFATLGGISLFGFTGFIVGPVIVALFLTLWDIYAVEFKSQLNKFNK